MVQLDERLSAIAELVLEALDGIGAPKAADIGCDHGRLTAHLLERRRDLTMIASDVSAPSLEKARQLLLARGLSGRAQTVVADGLSGITEPVHAIVLAGMGAETILRILEEGRERIGGAALIMQANVDLPLLRGMLAQKGFVVVREVFSHAAGRRYATMLARRGESRTLTAREALLGTALSGAQDEGQRAYFIWQRGVRVREMEKIATLVSENAAGRMEKNHQELTWIAEA
ncbi:MAG: SAM-dependent methyltransferase, partial [Clostridia bacterium]|nr:SAM-dependent methyltransferase [Clostridia bacterium]